MWITRLRRQGRPWWALGAVAGAVLLLSAGCSGNSAPEETTHASAMTFALPVGPASLDVPKNFDNDTMMVMAMVTEKLERISDSGELSPGLATSVTQPNPTTLEYHIRSGVKFSDGSPLTATDVAWSLQHLTDAKGGAQTAGNVPSFAGATATDPLLVTVTLTRPDAQARANLAAIGFIQQAAFGEAHATDLGTPSAIPIGTGPYVVSSSTTEKVTLTRNPNYWGQPPPVDQIDFPFIGTDNTAQLAMRSGSIQGAMIQNLKTADQWEAIEDTNLLVMHPLTTTLMSLDTTDKVLSDEHVRKAIAYSVDRAGVMAAAYGKYATLLQSIAPPGTLADVAPSTAEADEFLASLPQYEFSPAKAKEELAKSAYPNGFTLSAPYIEGQAWSQLTVLNLQQNMKALNVVVEPKPVQENASLTTLFAHVNPLGFQTMSGTAPIPDPAGILGYFTGKANAAPQGLNIANWTTPSAEQAHDDLMNSTDRPTRWSATKTLLTEMATDVPYIGLYNPDTVVVLTGGFSLPETTTLFDLVVNGTWVLNLQT
jgi:peptide/nickel transport system substrate-binding protein